MRALLDTQTEQSPVAPAGARYIDTHAHIHFDDFAGEVDAVLHRANEDGVTKVITVGVNTADSRRAAELAATYEHVWATVGIHPHEAAEIDQGIEYLGTLATRRKVVAIGECGLDFYRNHASADDQERALRLQVELAQKLELPLVFHVRDAFDRFLEIMSEYPPLPGVVHSFTAGSDELERVLERGWMVALNGITTFSKDESHREAVRHLPLDHLLLETDCPFLSPAPHRGKTNEPARTVDIATHIAQLRGEPVERLAAATTANAERLFGI